MRGVTLDTGALIALERGGGRITALLERISGEPGATVNVPAGVLGQAWRDGRHQARLARLLSAPETNVVELDELTARAVGVLLGRTGTSDVVDASVAICARECHQAVVSSDPDDLHRLAPGLLVIAI